MLFVLCLLSLISRAILIYAAPEVKVGHTTFVGRDITSLQQDFFGGIPYAEPPVGNLRFQPPILKDTYDEETFDASQLGPACLQFNMTLGVTSEDCLILNVLRPANISAHMSLPVLFWVHGGGFDRGSSRDNNGSAIVARSVQRGTPIVFVSINYRLGAFGFPQGKEAEDKGRLNLALKDELTALEWVHKHIGKFGGDKHKVTIGGVSAGAIMNAVLFLHPDITKFVRAGIFESGSAATPLTHTAPFRQHSWDQFVSSVPACASLAGTDNTFDCLVDADITDLLEGINASREFAIEDFPWDPTLDGLGGIYPDYPSVLFQRRQFARIPFVAGTNLDEGTVFVDPLVNFTNEVVRDSLYRNFSTPFLERFEKQKLESSIERLMELYPDDPSLGSPFGTGDETFGLSPGFKRMSAILGDVAFTSQRRFWQQKMAEIPFSGVKSYGYLWKQGTLQRALFPEFGVSHGSDSHYFFNDTLVDTQTVGALECGTSLMDYFLSFIDGLDPNDGRGIQRPNWSQYSEHNQVIMQMVASNITEIPDTFRKRQIDFINSLPDIFHH